MVEVINKLTTIYTLVEGDTKKKTWEQVKSFAPVRDVDSIGHTSGSNQKYNATSYRLVG